MRKEQAEQTAALNPPVSHTHSHSTHPSQWPVSSERSSPRPSVWQCDVEPAREMATNSRSSKADVAFLRCRYVENRTRWENQKKKSLRSTDGTVKRRSPEGKQEKEFQERADITRCRLDHRIRRKLLPNRPCKQYVPAFPSPTLAKTPPSEPRAWGRSRILIDLPQPADEYKNDPRNPSKNIVKKDH